MSRPAAVGSITWSDDLQVWVINAKPDVMMRLRRIFPRVQSTYAGALSIADTPDVVRDLGWIMRRWRFVVPTPSLRRLDDRYRAAVQLEETMLEILRGDGPVHTDHVPARTPRPHQLMAANLALATGSLLVVHGVGMGKTCTSLLTLRKADALPALAVTLGGVLPDQWLHQLELTFPEMRGHILRTGPLYDPEEREGAPVDLLIAPYSRLAKWQDHLAGKVRTVIFDEVQELRHENSQKWSAARKVAEQAQYVLGLTATPIYNYGGEMHTLTEQIRPGALGSRQEFLREWEGHQAGAVAGNYVVDQMGPLGEHMIGIGLMDRKTRRDVAMEMDEPERIEYEINLDRVPLDVALEPARVAARRYLDATEGIDKMQAARELDYLMRQATGLAKAPHVAELVHLLLQSEEKVIVFGWHHEVYKLLAERLSVYGPVQYTGRQSVPQKRVAIESFMTGTSRVMLMSLRAGAGIDGLQDVCNTAVFAELDWSPGVHTQDIGRIARDHMDGRIKTDPCVAYFATCGEGSDPTMTDVLGIKTQQGEQLTDPEGDPVTLIGSSDRLRRLAQEVLTSR